MPLFAGCATALVTPFTPSGDIDEPALRRLIAMQLSAGIDAIVLLGTTGEPSTLDMAERERVIAVGLKVTEGRVPVIVGTGANDTRKAAEYARQAKALGAHGQLCVTPFYNKASQIGLLRHYEAILSAADLPMIVYNVPSRTGMTIAADTARALALHPLVMGIKEASGDLALTTAILAKTDGSLPVYCGNDDLIMPMMAMGAVGAISVSANVVPDRMRALTNACLSHRYAQAQKTQRTLMPLIGALLTQVNPIPVKAALSMMGLCADVLRLPLTPMESPHRERLRGELLRMGLISAAD